MITVKTSGWTTLGCLILLACAATAARMTASVDAPVADSPEAAIQGWPAASRLTARQMLETYGRPDQFDRNSLVWFNNGNWKRTIVSRRGLPPAKRKDCLQQTIGYLVPEDRIPALKQMQPSIEASSTAGELTVASGSERANILAMNLADEIVTGKRDAPDARAFYARTLKLSAAGKSSSYSDGFLFEVDNTRYMTPTGADR